MAFLSVMNAPPWLTALVAIAVTFFGVYRFYISFRSEEDEQVAKKMGGLYAMKRRTHRIIGALYIFMGAFLFASLFGVNILRL